MNRIHRNYKNILDIFSHFKAFQKNIEKIIEINRI